MAVWVPLGMPLLITTKSGNRMQEGTELLGFECRKLARMPEEGKEGREGRKEEDVLGFGRAQQQQTRYSEEILTIY